MGIGGAHPGGFSLTKHLIHMMDIPLSSHILDAGCGTGQTLKYLYDLGYKVTGIDKDLKMIKRAKKRFGKDNPPSILQADLCHLPFSSNTFDVVLCESVLSFTPLEKTLPNVFDILKPNGTLVAIEMVVQKPLTAFEQKELQLFYGFHHFLSEEQWIKFLQKHQFTNFKLMSKNEISFADLDTTTEFELEPLISENVFNIYDEHEKLTNKYSEKLDYQVFICKN